MLPINTNFSRAVHHIYGSMLRVALPGTVAHLPLANVSASYSSLAERWACIPQKKNQRRTLADPSLPEKLLTLDELFKIGQVLKFAVQMTSSDSPVRRESSFRCISLFIIVR